MHGCLVWLYLPQSLSNFSFVIPVLSWRPVYPDIQRNAVAGAAIAQNARNTRCADALGNALAARHAVLAVVGLGAISANSFPFDALLAQALAIPTDYDARLC